jgi:hypothetical protein
VNEGDDTSLDQSSREAAQVDVRSILQEQIDLAKPDDLVFLESQVDYIARLIIDRLGWRGGPAE